MFLLRHDEEIGYAITWPSEIKNADVWRLRVTVSREPPRFVLKIRDMLLNQISIPNYGTHTVVSSPVQDCDLQTH